MTTKLLLSSLVGVGAIGGVATGTYFLLPKNKNVTIQKTKPKNMSELVTLNKWNSLNFNNASNDETWGKLVEKYFDSSTEQNRKISTTRFTGTLPSDKAPSIVILKDECKKLFEKEEDFEKDKEIFKDWCTQETTLVS